MDFSLGLLVDPSLAREHGASQRADRRDAREVEVHRAGPSRLALEEEPVERAGAVRVDHPFEGEAETLAGADAADLERPHRT